MTEDQLKDFLRKSAADAWDATREPYLLSYVANELKEQGEDYKSALSDEERLKGFAERVERDDRLFKVVQHPSQKAKVGLIPYEESYVFPVGERDNSRAEARASRTRNETALLGFFEALKGLPDDLLDDVHISTKVIVALLRKR